MLSSEESYLWRPEAEGGCPDVGLVPLNQMQTFVLCEAHVPPSGHMAQSERLSPACMTSTPPEERQDQF